MQKKRKDFGELPKSFLCEKKKGVFYETIQILSSSWNKKVKCHAALYITDNGYQYEMHLESITFFYNSSDGSCNCIFGISVFKYKEIDAQTTDFVILAEYASNCSVYANADGTGRVVLGSYFNTLFDTNVSFPYSLRVTIDL